MYRNHRRKIRGTESHNSKFKKVVALALIIFVGQFFYFAFYVNPGTNNENSVTISINPGEGLKEIASQLKEKNVINSKLLFIGYAKNKGFDTKIQSGVFQIPLPQNLSSTVQILTTVPDQDKVTIPEGLKITQIDSYLANKGLIQAGDFINCVQTCNLNHPVLDFIPNQSTRNLEGFLFPDTYFINTANFSSESLILKMLDNFQSKIPSDYLEKSQSLPKTDFYSIITMASIIEREVLSLKDKKMVSGLLWKRYSSGWLIDADASLLYLKNNNIITRADLDSDSPYNIRKFKGLPPTPIANPGLASIEAALNPTDSAYWFYLTTLDTGEVIYARTNDEHNQNKFKYLR